MGGASVRGKHSGNESTSARPPTYSQLEYFADLIAKTERLDPDSAWVAMEEMDIQSAEDAHIAIQSAWRRHERIRMHG